MTDDLEPRDADEAALIERVSAHDRALAAEQRALYERDEQVVAMLALGASPTRIGRLCKIDASQVHRVRREWPGRAVPKIPTV